MDHTKVIKDEDCTSVVVQIQNDKNDVEDKDDSSFIPESDTVSTVLIESELSNTNSTFSINIPKPITENLLKTSVECISKVSELPENMDIVEMQDNKSEKVPIGEDIKFEKVPIGEDIKSEKVPLDKAFETQTDTTTVFPSTISKNVNNKVKHHVVSENQERINYLFQVSNYLNNVENADNFKNESASIGSMAMAIGRKCVLRLSHDLKRQLCKGCGSAILPVISSKYRLKNNRQKHLVVTCNKCKTIKRLPTNPNYTLWSDNAESSSL